MSLSESASYGDRQSANPEMVSDDERGANPLMLRTSKKQVSIFEKNVGDKSAL